MTRLATRGAIGCCGDGWKSPRRWWGAPAWWRGWAATAKPPAGWWSGSRATERYARERYGDTLAHPFTVSCGVAPAASGASVDEVLQAADTNLYRTKRARRWL